MNGLDLLDLLGPLSPRRLRNALALPVAILAILAGLGVEPIRSAETWLISLYINHETSAHQKQMNKIIAELQVTTTTSSAGR